MPPLLFHPCPPGIISIPLSTFLATTWPIRKIHQQIFANCSALALPSVLGPAIPQDSPSLKLSAHVSKETFIPNVSSLEPPKPHLTQNFGYVPSGNHQEPRFQSNSAVASPCFSTTWNNSSKHDVQLLIWYPVNDCACPISSVTRTSSWWRPTKTLVQLLSNETSISTCVLMTI